MLAGVERFIEVLPRRPGHLVGAAEPMSRHAEVVDEPVDSYGPTAVLFLSNGQSDGHGVASWDPTLWAGRLASMVLLGVWSDHAKEICVRTRSECQQALAPRYRVGRTLGTSRLAAGVRRAAGIPVPDR